MSCEADAHIQNANRIYEIQLCSHIAMQSRNIASFLATALALLRTQTERTLPLIRLTSSLFVAALGTTSYAVFFFLLSLNTEGAADSHKQQMERLFAYRNVFCCVKKKHKHRALPDCTERLSRRDWRLLLLFTLNWDYTVNWVWAFNRS